MNSYQYECLLLSKSNIIRMLILNIKHIPSTFWHIKKQFLKFFKDFLIRINRRQEEEAKKNPAANHDKNVFIEFKNDILDPKFITKQSDNNIEIFKEFSYLIIEFSIRYLKVADKNYDQAVISAILQLLRHQISYPVEKIECAAEYFMRLTILSINKGEEQKDEASSREKTIYHNELVEAICDASLERAEYLNSLSQREEELGTFDTKENSKESEVKGKSKEKSHEKPRKFKNEAKEE